MDPVRVRQARLEAGLSLAQVAGDDVSRTFIHFVEQGRARPSQAVLKLIARRTGKPMSYFIADAPDVRRASSDLAEELTRAATQVHRFAALRQLTQAETEGMRLLEAAIQQGAAFVRAVERSAKRAARRTRAHSAEALIGLAFLEVASKLA